MYCEEEEEGKKGGLEEKLLGFNYHSLKNKKPSTFQILCWREKCGMRAPHLMSSSSTSTCTSRINAPPPPPLSVTINVYINPPLPSPAYIYHQCLQTQKNKRPVCSLSKDKRSINATAAGFNMDPASLPATCQS